MKIPTNITPPDSSQFKSKDFHLVAYLIACRVIEANQIAFEKDDWGLTMILQASAEIDICLNNFTQNKPIGIQDFTRAMRKLKAMMKQESMNG